MQEEEEFESSPLSYAIDNAILMHRDAHFGGKFDTMLDYYRNGGRGVSNDFTIERIEELSNTETKTGKNLAPFMLSGAEAEKVARSRLLYQQLRDLYEVKKPKSPIPTLIADLILAEEDEIDDAVKAAAEQKSAIVPALIDLLRNEEFYDPLFPGYGQAPLLAAQCLGKIGDKRAIISLFESIGSGDFFNEDMILNALHSIGKPAKEFLVKVLHGKPLNIDNEHAAVALVNFKDDPEVASTALKMLHEIDLPTHTSLATYLALICEGLTSQEERNAFLALAKKPHIPKSLQQDMIAVSHAWNNT